VDAGSHTTNKSRLVLKRHKAGKNSDMEIHTEMKNLKGKKVLVTGAGGFIGSHLTEGLVRAGADVCAFVHYNSRNDWGNIEFLDREIFDQVKVIAGDITDPFSTREAVHDREIVFHLGALIGIPYSYVAPAHYIAVNINGTINLLEAARRAGTLMIHTSTSEVYGTAQYTPIDEQHPLVGQSPYSASKIGADKMVESYHNSFELPTVIVRPFNNYGPRQSARAIIPTIMTQLAMGFSEIKLGSLEPIRDLTYVADTVRGYLLAASCGEAVGQTINLGNGKGITMGKLAETIIRISGKDAVVVTDNSRVRPRSSEVMNLIADNSKAKAVIGWEPEIELEKGLDRCYGYIREHMDLYKPDIYNI
jgi:NAD dependent epimerase/dehydratase